MAPRFFEASFTFEKGEQVPEHEEGWSGEVERDPKLWHLNGYDRFEGSTYPIASNIEDHEVAELLARAVKRSIVKVQARSGSIQDSVHVISPEG